MEQTIINNNSEREIELTNRCLHQIALLRERIIVGNITNFSDLKEHILMEIVPTYAAEDVDFIKKLILEELIKLKTSNTIDVPQEEIDNFNLISESNINETTSRFSGAIWYEEIQKQSIILAGIGGIGSYVAYMLARLAPNSLYLYDPDRVELANMSGQLYSIENVGQHKTQALIQTISNYTQYTEARCISQRYTEGSLTRDIMICGFDNMGARKIYFNKWLERLNSSENPEKCLFIDGRLAAEEFQIFCIAGNDTEKIAEYRDTYLFDSSEAEETICSYKQTTFMAEMIAAYMVNCFVNFIANQCNPLFPRTVPFLTTYEAEYMFFKVLQ